ncbi:hypothetical protein [Nonomuraea roseoviolacea]|uniref:Uncharacterized protein n=1 Tax=Nonomuraea roseoviolacea subsp. carminata TaxID=160689 RepID=A0ABT1JZU5_9ACTN|nr:hypothetical protein [Nonomuraea roseoviolacea]MCP2346932.1 hypothetical protein [Nonomuraea roseoviolacea subsp. carminata]
MSRIAKVTTLLIVTFDDGSKRMTSQHRATWTNLPHVDQAELHDRSLSMLLEDPKVRRLGFTRQHATTDSFSVSIPR